MKNEKENNLAFIDGQNLYRGTTLTNPKWKVDLFKFRKYLYEKYNVEKAYYFLGFLDESNQNLYDDIQEAGFIIKFREHNSAMIGKKKGLNVIFLGDRISPQLTEFKDGKIIVNYAERKEGDSFADVPSIGVSRYFQVINEELVEDLLNN